MGQSLHLLPLVGHACMRWPYPETHPGVPTTPAQGTEEGAKAVETGPARPHLEQLAHGDGLQDALVVLQQAALGNAGPGHDVVQHGLHHALAHRCVQAAVHDAPRAANEADALTVPAGGTEGCRAW